MNPTDAAGPPADDDARPLTPAQAGAWCGRTEDQVRKWIKYGVRLNGTVVKLTASLTIGVRFTTTLRELKAFRAECQRVRGMAAVVEAPTPAERARRGRKAKEAAAKLLG